MNRSSKYSIGFILVFLTGFLVIQGQTKTFISVVVKDSVLTKLNIYIFKDPNLEDYLPKFNESKNGKFEFDFTLERPGYCFIDFRSKSFNYFLIEPGDSIQIEYSSDSVLFSGIGSSKCKFTYKFWNQYLIWQKKNEWKNKQDVYGQGLDYFAFWDSCLSVSLKSLLTYKDSTSSIAYKILQADVIAKFENNKLAKAVKLFNDSSNLKKLAGKKLYSHFFLTWNNDKIIEHDDTTALSMFYLLFLYQKSIIDLQMQRDDKMDTSYSVRPYYQFASAIYHGLVKEKVLMLYLFTALRMGINDDLIYCIDDYSKQAKNRHYVDILTRKYNDYKRLLANGKAAFNFSLPTISGNHLKLNSFKGKVVVLDFWFYKCVGCVKMSKAIKFVKEQFKDNEQVAFINISIDTKIENWLSGIYEYGLSDDFNVYTEGKGEDHPSIKQYLVSEYPTLFVIGKDGKFVSVHPPDPRKDGGHELIELIKSELQ